MGSDGVQKVNNIKFSTYKELIDNMRQSGIESLQSAIFIDFSKSNMWTGEKTYGYPLHDLNQAVTPYEHVLKTLSPVLKDFDDDDLYPVYRFGCMETKDKSVTPLLHPQVQNEHFKGMLNVCASYRQAIQFVQLSGPTTFAPAINRGIQIAQAYSQQGQKQHIVLIVVTDGDVSDEMRDQTAVCQASNFPISICVIGVGDGPFEKMEKFDNLKYGRRFDNFHFVNFTAFIRKAQRQENPELALAADVFSEVGQQHKAMKQLGYI